MTRASRKTCQVPGCQYGDPDDNGLRGPYTTDEECSEREEVMQDLNLHMEMAHNFAIKQQQDETNKIEAKAKLITAQAQKIAAENAVGNHNTDVSDEIESESGSSQSNTTRQAKFNDKRENLPRPKITEDSNESDWAFFKAQWARYVQGTQMSPTTSAALMGILQ